MKAANSAPPFASNFIHAADCREVMRQMGDNSVSLVLTDPPYFIDGMGDDWDRRKLHGRIKKGVIGSLPAGMKFDRRQGQRLQEFLTPIAAEWMRLVKPGGFVLCFSQNRLAHRAAIAIEDAGFEIRDVLAWQYEGQAKAFTQTHFIRKNAALSPQQKSSILKRLDNRKTPQLKPQSELIILAQAPRDGTFIDNWLKWECGLIDVSAPLLCPQKFPGTVLPVAKPKRARYGHITAKPVPLLRHLIRIFSKEGAAVFDPFAGSGSAGVAAVLEGRVFSGAESDKEMAATANSRIQAAQAAGDENQTASSENQAASDEKQAASSENQAAGGEYNNRLIPALAALG